ncbi:MAG: outer membrane protein assembly factor BamD [Deltaproteobacteria bacterium]|nr:outer membrane protein assembly factor BamD [Deltaproteobacteria bacterium]MBI3391447.1 outer membrane protein assembly factor BamD [Deltaproteobacteria bacterium]
MALAASGCGAKKKLLPEGYFKQATADFENGAFPIAIDEYKEMLDQYPFDEHAEEAELKIAHAQYLAGNLTEAVASLTDFQRRHPTSPQLPFVGYALGLCYARQMGTIDRDQTASQNAHNYFATVAQQYPNSPFAELAREQLALCRNNLAGHELYVADFYAHKDNQKAAEYRLLGLLGRYDDTDVAADALTQLARAYRKGNDPERALLADAALAQHFPNTKQARSARRRIEKQGQEELLANDPMPRLLAGVPQSRDITFSPPVQVPGLDKPDHAPASAAAAQPPSPFGHSGSRY